VLASETHGLSWPLIPYGGFVSEDGSDLVWRRNNVVRIPRPQVRSRGRVRNAPCSRAVFMSLTTIIDAVNAQLLRRVNLR